MVQESTLSSVLSEFARVMLTDFPIQKILDHLVERIVDVLPVTGAGVTLIAPGLSPRYIAASDATAMRFERVQTDLGQGPCLTSFTTGEPVFMPDVAADGRYPAFGPAAVAEGMAAVFTFPLRHRDGCLGSLDLYRDVPGPLSGRARSVAQTLADVAAAYLINAQAREEALQAAEWFRDRALHDPLTGLANRVLLQERIDHAAQRARRSHMSVGVLFVDLDHFKRVNDDFGHRVGDELLIAVGHRLAALVRPGDTLARLSGDEFAFLCEDLLHSSDVEVLASRIGEAFTAPFVLPGAEVSVTASVGIAYAGPGEAVTDSLVLDADIAMYQAKRRGGGTHQIVDLRTAGDSRDRHELEQELRVALARSELDLAYQPIVRMVDGSVVGVEALLRWTHPARGAVPAEAAIAVAEQSGLITRLGAWVLERACRDRTSWLVEHPGQPLDLSVNVSPRQLMTPGFVTSVSAVLGVTAMDPAALVLEVTEGILIEDGDRAMRVLGDLKRLGVRLALDDFGTGYCSLSYLQRFPIDIVKIDQSFVSRLGPQTTASAIAASVTNLAHLLDMEVTAEGIETGRQHDEVVSIGCDLGQGFLYAEPTSTQDLFAQPRLSGINA
ncbi:putative bifunctional diguanylate cyclase/phosphodiesterase [Pengzhenrongella frigida]|uniref:EAL domain-containing protein n=1 Tax=Pengzhenrongella frigida TaxID=1259133 RepID=A0A4Q5N3P2_9MICO|nr:EAL domain-containing protein [Cellulomonas sp. HLT2-17]RYV52859.1 EAL domain-containing protein [Cellulomonas sp. HLT2-17]